MKEIISNAIFKSRKSVLFKSCIKFENKIIGIESTQSQKLKWKTYEDVNIIQK